MMTTSKVEQISEAGQYGATYRVLVNGTVRCCLTGSREQAERLAADIVRGMEADARWVAAPSFTEAEAREALDAAHRAIAQALR